jgi:hypothetical protein
MIYKVSTKKCPDSKDVMKIGKCISFHVLRVTFILQETKSPLKLVDYLMGHCCGAVVISRKVASVQEKKLVSNIRSYICNFLIIR